MKKIDAQAKVYSGSGIPCLIRYKGKVLEFPTEVGKSYLVQWQGGRLSVKDLHSK